MDDALTYNLIGIVPDTDQWLRVSARLIAALLLGAIVGIQRELQSKPAGVRTHALVSLGAALFTIIPVEAGMQLGDLSRVIQGIATGIGFIGAGVIVKIHVEREVIGLTTAATVWAATAIGVAVGMGHILLATVGVVLTWLVLAGFARLDSRISRYRDD